ncbi:lysophospholipid acyltransferase family protein [Saccharospirillum sp. HFRX-1]|uniref:lysophospholipid acyltransferase family protein n=1 Tax=unclassified Saccharospirillum TaxID=2633430 RepID=UPI0037105C05
MWLAYLRTFIFYACFYGPFTICWASFCGFFAFLLPYRLRYHFVIGTWAKVAVWGTRWILGIKYRVTGLEHLDGTAAVIVSNHQSAWETFFLQRLFRPQTQVVKKSLLRIPFFGWTFSLLRPIAIDRADRKASMTQIMEQGVPKLQDGIFVLIFPEGTRAPAHAMLPFRRGGAVLAKAAEAPIIPVTHNSGDYWLNKRFVKLPGTIDVIIHPPIYVGDMAASEAMKEAERCIGEGLARIHGERASVSPDNSAAAVS